jgi:hypothetical protein
MCFAVGMCINSQSLRPVCSSKNIGSPPQEAEAWGLLEAQMAW